MINFDSQEIVTMTYTLTFEINKLKARKEKTEMDKLEIKRLIEVRDKLRLCYTLSTEDHATDEDL